jgi:carbonic anhydrase
MSMARSVLRDVHDRHAPGVLNRCEVEVVRLSLANLMTFPWIAEEVDGGRLALAGFRFEIRTGILERLGDGGMVPVT